MFCPKCGGSSQNDALRFCNFCGANLYAVRQVLDTRETGEKLDWSKTWVADMLLSEDERKRRQRELELQQGITPEVKRLNEIKAGVITSCVGVAVSIFLFVLMQGVIRSGQGSPGDAEILSRVWAAGLIPFMVGVALMINGVFVTRRLGKTTKDTSPLAGTSDRGVGPRSLRPLGTNEFTPPQFGVTEGTTKHLNVSAQQKNDD